MKFFRYIAFSLIIAGFYGCKKDAENRWNTDVPAQQPAQIADISKEFYDPNTSLEAFKQKYPWFQGTVSDEDFAKRKADPEEIKVYREAASKIDQNKLQKDLSSLFARIKFYFPKFQPPKVFLFSSAMQMATEPVFFQPQANMLFIDLTGFMGEKNANYAGINLYQLSSMNPQNLLPKVSETLAENLVPVSGDHQKFIDMMVYSGKLMTLQDAFLPEVPDHLKINYTQKQYDWAKANEANVWNYFVENNLVFSDDQRLGERFLSPGPFSKFYTEIDNQSSPQIGVFSGWQICRKFLQKNPDTKLPDFLKMNATEIFNQAEYKP